MALRYQLHFAGKGSIVGTGPNDCELEGKFYWNHKIYKPSN